MLLLLPLGACTNHALSFKGDGNKPEALPNFADLQLYSDDSPFNTKIGANASVDRDSRMYIDALVDSAKPQDNFVLSLKQFTTTVFTTDADTPRKDMYLACGDYWRLRVNTLLDVPLPSFAEPTYDKDGENHPIKGGKCGENSDQDNTMVLLDLENRCEYDFWQARKVDGVWEASWGNAISMDSNGVFPYGLSTRGSGFAFLGGLIWPDELKAGYIDHALVFNYSLTRAHGPVSPATESDGLVKRDSALPEGALLRLDPNLDLSTLNLTSAEATVARALQEFGMYLCDNGGGGGNGSSGGTGIGIYAVNPSSVMENPYLDVLPDKTYPIMDKIPLNKLQVLKLPAQDTAFQNKLKVNQTECAQFD